MLKSLKKFINYLIMTSILFALLGIIIAIFPDTTLSVVSNLIALVEIILGIYLVVMSIIVRDDDLPFDSLGLGILIFMLGLILIIYPNTINILMPIVLGIWFIITGVNQIRMSNLIRCVSTGSYVVSLIVGILSIICGIIFILNPMTSSSVITSAEGIVMLIYALNNLVDAIIYKVHLNKIVKNFKKKLSI